jgi:hypothetical protein
MKHPVLLAIASLAGGLIVVALADARVEFFRTPSGNIGCIYNSSPQSLRCDIRTGLKPRPTRPASCDLDWGDSVSLGRTGRTKLVCHGDTVFGSDGRVMRYGTTWKRGPFTCTSRTIGLTCRNAAAHGFFLSRQRWRRF